MGTNAATDSLQQQVMWNRLLAVVEEQAQTLLRTAFSPIVRECGDLSAGVFDLRGRMLAQAVTGTPGHINSMAASVAHFIDHFPTETMADGDAYITNDPWLGTGHLNDFTVTTPCFYKGRLVALFACTAHITDVGGIGMSPDATDVHMEGLYVPMTHLVRQGDVDRTLMRIVRANTRSPTETEGDIYSLAACNDVGCRRLVEMMDEFAIDAIEDLAEVICSRSEAAVRREIARLPQGAWRNAMTIDGIDGPLTLAAELRIGNEGIVVDYAGSSPKCAFGINVPLAYTAAYSCFGLRCLIAPEVPNNAGSLAPFQVRAPEGSLLNATYPAAVCARHIIGQMLPDVVFGCMDQVVPDLVPAEGASCLWSITLRGPLAANGGDGRLFTITAITNGGTGGRPGKDGMSATAFPSGVRGTPVEINEVVAPLLIRRKEYRADSAGPGRHRGGLGQVIEIESAIGADFDLLAAFDRVEYPARGRHGGHAGERGAVRLASGKTLRGKGSQRVPAGDRLILHTPGGGGYGDPAERDGRAVRADTAADLISETAAPGNSKGVEGP